MPARIEIGQITGQGVGPFAGGLVFENAIGFVENQVYFSEEFSGSFPGAWTIVDGGTGSGAASTWTTANPGSRAILDAPFVIADSDNLGSGQTMDEELISRPWTR